MPLVHRRGLLLGLGSLLAAPAIVRAESLMPVRSIERFSGLPIWEVRGWDQYGNPVLETFRQVPWKEIYAGLHKYIRVGDIYLRGPQGQTMHWSRTVVEIPRKDPDIFGHPEPLYTNSELSPLGERGVHDPTTGKMIYGTDPGSV